MFFFFKLIYFTFVFIFLSYLLAYSSLASFRDGNFISSSAAIKFISSAAGARTVGARNSKTVFGGVSLSRRRGRRQRGCNIAVDTVLSRNLLSRNVSAYVRTGSSGRRPSRRITSEYTNVCYVSLRCPFLLSERCLWCRTLSDLDSADSSVLSRREETPEEFPMSFYFTFHFFSLCFLLEEVLLSWKNCFFFEIHFTGLTHT